MPLQESNTAADRLLRIVRDVAGSRDDLLTKVWARALSLKSSDKLVVFRGILSLAALVEEIEATVKKHSGPATKLYLRSLDQIRLMLMVNLDNNGNALNSLLKAEVISDLEHCAAMYSTIDHEVIVPKEQVESIKNQVEELFKEINATELPDELRDSLLDLVDVIRRQMAEFEIRGAATLQECLRQSLARLMEIYSVEQSRESEPVLKKLFVIVTSINNICELAQKALPILKTAKKLLPFIAPDTNHLISDAVEVEVIPDEKS